MLVDDELRNTVRTVMGRLLPLDQIPALSLEDTYLLRERVALVFSEVEFYRIQVENHLADLNARMFSKAPPKLDFKQDPLTKLAKALAASDLNIDDLISSLSEGDE